MPPHRLHSPCYFVTGISKGQNYFALPLSSPSAKFDIKCTGNPDKKILSSSFPPPTSFLISFTSTLFFYVDVWCLIVQHEYLVSVKMISLHFRYLLSSIVYLYVLLFNQLCHTRIDDHLYYHLQNPYFLYSWTQRKTKHIAYFSWKSHPLTSCFVNG